LNWNLLYWVTTTTTIIIVTIKLNYYYYYYMLSHLYRVYILIQLKQTSFLWNSVAAVLQLLFMAYIMLVPMLYFLYFYISAFRSTCAVPNMAVLCTSLI
jgi:hypothetical protein